LGEILKAVLAVLLFCCSALHAGLKEAQAFYMEGMKLQSQRQYQAALAQYEKSLQAEPRYVYAYKQMGTCKYYLRDNAGALAAYDKYLAAVPSDSGVKAFAGRLRGTTAAGFAASEATGGSSSEDAKRKKMEARFHPGFFLSLGSTYNTYSMADWNSYVSSSGYSGGGITSGYAVGLNAGYSITSMMKIGADLDYMLAGSSASSSSGFASYSSSYSLNALWFGPEFDYGFMVGLLRLRPELGIGYMQLLGAGMQSTYSFFGSSNTATGSFNGSGIGARLSCGVDLALGPSVSVSLDLGYRYASISPVVATVTSGGYSSTYTLMKIDPATGLSQGNLSLDYSGLFTRIALNFLL
jgi:hypothetical protein